MPQVLTVFAHPTHGDPALWLIAAVDPEEIEHWTVPPDEIFATVPELLAVLDRTPAVCRVTIAAQGAMRDALERAIALRDLPYELDEGSA